MPPSAPPAPPAPLRTEARLPKPRRQRFDGKEAEYLLEAIGRDNLFYAQPGGFVGRMTERAAAELQRQHAVATSSGTAALHVAMGALEVAAGAEVITSPITDMGTAIAILFQNAIPVFADVDPHTCNITAESIAAVMTERTQAVMVVHLAGNPCEMEPIRNLCRRRGVKLIEDCAQAWGSYYDGRHVGGFGDVGCFSFNHIKHLSCGEGGLVVTDDSKLASRARNFADKYYDRGGEGVRLQELGINYRMTELQGAVALAQFDRLARVTETRRRLGDHFTQKLAGIDEVAPHAVTPGGSCSYWFYVLRLNEASAVKRDDLLQALADAGAECKRGYLARPLYHEPVFIDKRFFAGGVWPAELVAGRSYDYKSTHCPVAEAVLGDSIVVAIHEGLDESDIDRFAAAIQAEFA